MVQKFEVGKKYKHSAGVVRECVYSGKNLIVLKGLDGYEHSFQTNTLGLLDHWSEYRETVVSKFVRHVSRDQTDMETWRDIHNINIDNGDVYVGSVEFTVTDGKLTDVRIL